LNIIIFESSVYSQLSSRLIYHCTNVLLINGHVSKILSQIRIFSINYFYSAWEVKETGDF